MRGIILFLLIYIAFVGDVYSAEKKCLKDIENKGDQVFVKVKEKHHKDKRLYHYSVTNKMPFNLVSLVIGRGEENDDIQAFEPNIPELFHTPKNWNGINVFPDEGDYMYLYWQATEEESYISSGKSMAGFSIELVPDRFSGMDLVYSGRVKEGFFSNDITVEASGEVFDMYDFLYGKWQNDDGAWVQLGYRDSVRNSGKVFVTSIPFNLTLTN